MVDTIHASYLKFSKQTKKVRDVLEGDTNLRTTTYAPKLETQTPQEYSAYVNRPPFANFSERLLDTMIGLAFAKKPIIDLSSNLQKIENDLDMNDMSSVDLGQIVVQELFVTGRIGILVNFDNSGITEALNGLEAEKYFRPYVSIYKHENIINWKVRNNKLTQVVLSEYVEFEVDEFATDTQEQFLVLDIFEGKCRARRMIKQDGKDVVISEIFPTQNGNYMTYIPFYYANAEQLSIEPIKPPMYNITDLNASHFRLNVELYHALFFVGNPTPYGSGIDETDVNFSLGSSEVKFFVNPNAKLQYLEFQGQGLGAIENKLKETENNMASMGAEFLRDKNAGNVSTETISIRTAGDRATLISVVDTASRLITLVLQEMERFYPNPQTDNITYAINKDYALITLDAQKLTAYGNLNTMGILSDYDIWYNFKKSGEIDETLSFQDWMEYRQESSSSQMLTTPTTPTPTADNSGFINSLRDKLGI